MKHFLSFLFFILLIGCKQDKQPILFMIGDSTMANKEKLYLPERGWGQLFPACFKDGITIDNHAKNGRSTRSFIYEGRWDSVFKQLTPNDFVIIQFGHNDGSIEKTERYATPLEYRYNLSKFVNETRAKGAQPILCTPIVRRRFDDNSQFFDLHGQYPDIVRQVADSLNVPLLEMHKLSMELISNLGPEESKKIYLFIEPGQNDSLPEGKIDNTHFSEYGATIMAGIAAEEIKKIVPELAKFLK